MTWRTHLVGGVCSLAPLALMPSGSLTAEEAGRLVVFACLGSLLPDLDARESHLKHLTLGTGAPVFFLPATLLNRLLGHRGLLHSLLGLILIGLLLGLPLWFWLGPLAALALLLGFASHLALDACTKHGIVLAYPAPKRWHLLPPGFRVTTGSNAEEPVFVALALGAVMLLLRLLTPALLS